jgi:hypothetical protein
VATDVWIADHYRKCVAFLIADSTNEAGQPERKPVGTAFLIGVPAREFDERAPEESSFTYVVTTRHLANLSYQTNLYLRVSRRAAGFIDIPIPSDSWVRHDRTDVAVAAIELPPDEELPDISIVRLERFMTDRAVVEVGVKEGDHLFFSGLFVQHHGRGRTLPIVRFGSIALMPHEPVEIETEPNGPKILVDAYLAESRSWGGASGSPVFIYFGLDRPAMYGHQRHPFLLGVVHGHYDIHREIEFVGDVLGGGKVPINAGIAIVIPAQKIAELLMQDDLVQERRKSFAEMVARRPLPTHDAG